MIPSSTPLLQRRVFTEQRTARASQCRSGVAECWSSEESEWQGTGVVEHCCAKATGRSSSGMPEQRDSGAVGCWCGRAPERRSGGAPESLERYRAGAAGCRCSGALERLNSSVPVQQSARATERWSNGAAGRRGTGMSKPRYRPCKSFTTDHLLRITFCTSFATDRLPMVVLPLHRLPGRPGWPHLRSDPFFVNRTSRMVVFQVLRAIFQKWKSSSTYKKSHLQLVL